MSDRLDGDLAQGKSKITGYVRETHHLLSGEAGMMRAGAAAAAVYAGVKAVEGFSKYMMA
jgi:hypothetical protein